MPFEEESQFNGQHRQPPQPRRGKLEEEILVAQAKQGGATCEPKRGVIDEASKEKELLAKANNHIPSGKPSKGECKEKPVLPRYLPPIPFPQRLAKEEDLENQVDAENGTRECRFRILDHIAPKAQGEPGTKQRLSIPLVPQVQDLILANVPVVVQTGPVSQEHASSIDLARENITKAIGWIVQEVNEKAA
nr:hypothetical protein Iba_chr12dCG7460 [Ipomoea batatas]